MLITITEQSSFQDFLDVIKALDIATERDSSLKQHILLFLTFKGCYSSLLSKERRALFEYAATIPLIEVDIHRSPDVYTRLQETMPTVILPNKLPVHLFCGIAHDATTKKLVITPLLRNFTTLGDAHFKQIHKLLSAH